MVATPVISIGDTGKLEEVYPKSDQSQIEQLTFSTIADAENGSPSVDNFCYISAAHAFYSFVDYPSDPPDRDGIYMLNTALGGNTRWKLITILPVDQEYLNFYVGSTLDEPNVVVSSDGATITATVEKIVLDIPGGDIRYRIKGETATLDCTPAASIELPAGTDTAFVTSYLWINHETNSLETGISGFPSYPHARLAKIILASAARTAAAGPMSGTNHKNHVFTIGDNGHMGHINDAFRDNPATYKTGLDFLATFVTATSVTVSVSAGSARRVHRHSISAITDPATFYIKNDETTPYVPETDIYNITTYSDGTSIPTNEYFALVFWESFFGDDSKLFVNKPLTGFVKAEEARSDTVNIDKSIPASFTENSVLVRRVICQRIQGGINVSYDQAGDDLRIESAGGAGGGVGPHASGHINDDVDPIPVVTGTTKGLMPPNDQATELGTTGSPQFNNLKLGTDALIGDEKLRVDGNILLGSGNKIILNHSGNQFDSIFSPIPGVIVEENLSRKNIYNDANNNNAADDNMYSVYAGGNYASGSSLLYTILKNGNSGFNNVPDPEAIIHARATTDDDSGIVLNLNNDTHNILNIRNDGIAVFGEYKTAVYTTWNYNDNVLPIFQINSTSFDSAFLTSRFSDNIYCSRIFFAKSRGEAIGVQGLVLDDDMLGEFCFNGSDGDQMREAARFTAIIDGTPTVDYMPTSIVFYTKVSAIGPIRDETIRFNPTGDTGVGTGKNILGRLHVKGRINFPIMRCDNADNEMVLGLSSVGAFYTSGPREKDYSIKTESYLITAVDPETFYMDTGAVALTVTLPASPNDCDIRTIKNIGSSGNDLTVAGNGQNINGTVLDIVLQDGISKTLQFLATKGWQAI